MNLSPTVDFIALGKATPGYVGSDLYALCSEAGLVAVRRIVQESIISNNTELPLCNLHSTIFQNVHSSNKSISNINKHQINSSLESDQDNIKNTNNSNSSKENNNTTIIPTNISPEKIQELSLDEAFEKSEEMILCDTIDQDLNDDDNENKNNNLLSSSKLLKIEKCFYCSLVDTSNSLQNENISITMDDFMKAAKSVQPTAKREGFAVVPDVTWKDVGALSEVLIIKLKKNINYDFIKLLIY